MKRKIYELLEIKDMTRKEIKRHFSNKMTK